MREPGVRVQVLYFASARERACVNRESVTLSPGTTVAQLRARLAELHPGLEALLPKLRFAVNQKLAEDGATLSDRDEVALIPPVAEGAGDFAVIGSPLELRAVVAAVEGAEVGGIATFTGNVRDHSCGKRVVKLEYEAYEPMAVASFRQIAAEIGERWPGTRVAIHHRIGTLEVGEAATDRPHQGADADLEEGVLRGRRGLGRSARAQGLRTLGPLQAAPGARAACAILAARAGGRRDRSDSWRAASC